MLSALEFKVNVPTIIDFSLYFLNFNMKINKNMGSELTEEEELQNLQIVLK